MIKEIVNLGKVVNPLASLFTMQVDDTKCLKIEIEDDKVSDIYLDSVIRYEEFLELGVFKEKRGNQTVLFPMSFILEIEKKSNKFQIRTTLKDFENGLKHIDDKLLEKIFEIIKKNFEDIKELALEIAGDIKNRKRVGVVIFYNGKPVFKYNDLFNRLLDLKISFYFAPYKKGICNVLGIEDELFYPKTNFYYPFSVDKKIVKFDLRDDKNLFLISKKAIEYFFAGKEYLEKFNRYKILGNFAFVTASSLDEKFLKEFEKLIIKNEEKNFKSLVDFLRRSSIRFKENILMNFYFHTSPAQGSKEIISYIKDVVPTYLVNLDKQYKKLRDDFDDIFEKDKVSFYWSEILNIIYNEEKLKREKITLFSKIVRNEKIDLKKILFRINRKSEKDGFYLNYYLFLIWIKGGSVIDIQGKDYEERLNFVLENFELVKNSNSAKAGVCVGLILKMLSFSINDFDKKVLSFAGKKIKRDKKSLLKFVNPIFERAKLHQNSIKQDINIKCASEIISNLDEFDKEEFIFGMFLGDEIYNYLKGEENE